MQSQSSFISCPNTVQPAASPHKIHVLSWSKQNKASVLPPLVCVHGLTRMAYDFVDIAQKLSETRDVYALSMAGRGESDWLADPMHYVYPNYAADCIYIIRQALKLGQVDWLGTSMGGLIGMWIASLDSVAIRSAPEGATARAEEARIIHRLVLNDIGPFLPLTAVQRIAFYAGRPANFATMEDAERHCRAIYADFGIKTDKDWRFFAEKTVRPILKRDASAPEGATGPALEGGYTLHYDPKIATAFGAVKEDISVWPMYDTVSCPTLLLRGVKSDVLSKEVATEMTQRGPKAQLVTFDNCGHAPALIDPEQIAVVEKFLS